MLKAWLRIILCRRSRDGNRRLKDQLEDLENFGKETFGRYKKHKHKELEESSTEWRELEEGG